MFNILITSKNIILQLCKERYLKKAKKRRKRRKVTEHKVINRKKPVAHKNIRQR